MRYNMVTVADTLQRYFLPNVKHMHFLSRNNLEHTIKRFINDNKSFYEKMALDMEKRQSHFQSLNTSRIRIALENFSDDMKFALFEVLFFLHVNVEAFSTYRYSVYKAEEEGKKHDEEVKKKSSTLYVPGAPHGVFGIERLCPLIHDDFIDYCSREFNVKKLPRYESNTFLSICSIGSVGTIAHKPGKSDLDIQVQYDLFPADISESFFSHDTISEILKRVNRLLQGNREIKHKSTLSNLIRDDQICDYVKIRFPKLMQYFLGYEQNETVQLNPAIIGKIITELEELYKTNIILLKKDELKAKEFLIQKKIKLIGEHVGKKFPNADIFFFSYTTDNYRRGQHGTTKKSKEASGSAYELILNYETLLPGIQFNGMIPSHFLFNETVNQHPEKYAYFVSLMRLNCSKPMQKFKDTYVDLGNTPFITKKYMVDHFGSVYWEAFKATQGNIAKALLNLLRIEVLMWKDVSPSVINCIKDRSLYRVQKNTEYDDEFGLKISPNKMFSSQDISEAEAKLPNLGHDPWWIRYKILKHSYDNPPGIITPIEGHQISRIIDSCFAIHIHLSDVIDEDSQNKKNIKTGYRNNFLNFFYNNAFPPFSSAREKINRILSGDINEMGKLEKEIKDVFHSGIQRVEFHSKINSNQFAGNREEFQIWHHYFKKYFNPPPNMIQISIRRHYKKEKNRLVILYRDKIWYFNSIYEQRTKALTAVSAADKQAKVELFRHHSFLQGFAYCILNNYFSVSLKGIIRKTLSTVELNSAGYNQQKDKIISRLPQDGADRIGRFILEKFVKFPVDFRDALQTENPIHDMCIFLNVMIFGKVDMLYRDTLNNWYHAGVTLEQIRAKSKHFFDQTDEFLSNIELFDYIYDFCKKSKMSDETMNSNLYFWINPSSLSDHGSTEERLASFELSFKTNFGDYIAKKTIS